MPEMEGTRFQIIEKTLEDQDNRLVDSELRQEVMEKDIRTIKDTLMELQRGIETILVTNGKAHQLPVAPVKDKGIPGSSSSSLLGPIPSPKPGNTTTVETVKDHFSTSSLNFLYFLWDQ